MRHLRQHTIASEDAKLSPFEQMLEQTLKHYNEAAWLGANSPLASPYLLYDFLGPLVSGKKSVKERVYDGDEHQCRWVNGRKPSSFYEVQAQSRLSLEN